MPPPRLSDCERQVPTSDIATVCCFWCGQRGHFWYDKYEKKKCTNQPKLAAVGGGGAQQREKEKEDKKGQQGSYAQRDSAFERNSVELLAPPVVPRSAQTTSATEAKAMAENAKRTESKEKAQQPRSVWAQIEHSDHRQLQRFDDVKEATNALEAAQLKILALEQKFTEAQLKITAMEKEREAAQKRMAVLQNLAESIQKHLQQETKQREKDEKECREKVAHLHHHLSIITRCLTRQYVIGTDEFRNIERAEQSLFGHAPVHVQACTKFGSLCAATAFGDIKMGGMATEARDWYQEMNKIDDCMDIWNQLAKKNKDMEKMMTRPQAPFVFFPPGIDVDTQATFIKNFGQVVNDEKKMEGKVADKNKKITDETPESRESAENKEGKSAKRAQRAKRQKRSRVRLKSSPS